MRQGAFLSWSLQALPRGSGQHCPFKAWPQSLISVVTGQVVRRYWPGPQGKLLGSRARRGLVVPGSEALPGKCGLGWKGDCQPSTITLGPWPPLKGAPRPACRTPACLVQSLLLAPTGCSPSMFSHLLCTGVGHSQHSVFWPVSPRRPVLRGRKRVFFFPELRTEG